MRVYARRLSAMAVVLVGLGGASLTAYADCSREVHQAFARQSNSEKVRKEMNLIGEQGPFRMTIEYVKPDRMRQVVTTLTDPDKPVETILIGKEAWSRAGGDWGKVDPDTTAQLIEFFKSTLADIPSNVGRFECMGAETIDGQKVRAYKGLPPEDPSGKPKTAAEKEAEAKNEGVRVVYLDIETGLPARIIFAQAGHLDTPIFREVYAYPETLEIEAPKITKP